MEERHREREIRVTYWFKNHFMRKRKKKFDMYVVRILTWIDLAHGGNKMAWFDEHRMLTNLASRRAISFVACLSNDSSGNLAPWSNKSYDIKMINVLFYFQLLCCSRPFERWCVHRLSGFRTIRILKYRPMCALPVMSANCKTPYSNDFHLFCFLLWRILISKYLKPPQLGTWAAFSPLHNSRFSSRTRHRKQRIYISQLHIQITSPLLLLPI
jgi:hypothetical protein